MATLTLRNIKGSALTFDELDSNFQALDSDITSINTTLSSGVGLGADSVNSLIDARIDSDDFVDLTTAQSVSGNKSFLGNVAIGGTATTNRFTIIDGNSDISMDAAGAGQFHIDGNGYGFAIALNADAANLYTNSPNRDLLFGVNETEVMRVTPAGADISGALSTDGQITIGLADGTAPLVITSTTLVTNLNADKVDGYNGIAVFDRAGTLLN